MQRKTKIPQSFRIAILVIGFLPLFYFGGKSIYDSRQALGSPAKPTKTYFEVFLPRKNEAILPYLTYFSDVNTPIATYEIKDSEYRLMILEVNLTSNAFDPSMFHIHPDKKKLGELGEFLFVNLGNSTKVPYRVAPRPTINSIHAYLNPKFPLQKLVKTEEYIYGKLSGDILFRFNLEDKRYFGLETTNVKLPPAPVEFLCFSKNQRHYIAVGVGNPPEGAEENYLKSLILED